MIFLITDTLAVIVSYILSYGLRFGYGQVTYHKLWFTLVFVYVITFISFFFVDLYNRRLYIRKETVFYRLIRAWFSILLLYVLVGFITRFAFLIESRMFIALYMLISLLMLITLRVISAKWWLDRYYSKEQNKSVCLFIGTQERYEKIKEFFRANPVLGLEPVLQDGGTIKNENAGGKPDNIFLWSDEGSFENLYKEIKPLAKIGVTLHIASKLLDELNLNRHLYLIDYVPVYTFHRRLWSVGSQMTKRIVDIACSLLALIVLSPVFLIIAVAVKIDSPGPVLFRQQRCGLNGRQFILYKFRTMYQSKGEDREREKKIKSYIDNKENKGKIINLANVTRIGRILRKTTIDELPQFWNVLKGEMTLVGPRPGIYYEVRHYKAWHRDRLLVKPGMSGLWAIYGRGHMPFDAAVFLDIVYALNRSISLDIKLMLKAIPVVLIGKGAY